MVIISLRNKINYLLKKPEKSKKDKFLSSVYWNKRYKNGGNSGEGSYHHLADFKAEIINNFLNKYKITKVIEFGCGDGNQISLINYENYLGFDVSSEAVNLCRYKFKDDKSKQFKLLDQYSGEQADLILSLDVIFHLIEDELFEEHIRLLFDASTKFVIIYSSNNNQQYAKQAIHVKHRNFTKWIDSKVIGWDLFDYIPNKYPRTNKDVAYSFSDFYFYKVSNI